MLILGIPFRTIPRKRTQLGILFRATKNRNILSECRSEPFRGRDTNSEQNAAAEYCNNTVVYIVLKESVHCSQRTDHPIYFVRINNMSLKFESSPRRITLVFQLHVFFSLDFSFE